MNFCEKCNVTVNGEICSNCGNKKVRTIIDSDYCFFMNLDSLKCSMFETALKDNEIDIVCIPYYQNNRVTFGNAGRADGRHVYIRYKDMEKVNDIYETMFSSNN